MGLEGRGDAETTSGSVSPVRLVGAGVGAGFVGIVVVGCVFGALYEYTDNLVVPIVTHATYNVVLMVLAYLTI